MASSIVGKASPIQPGNLSLDGSGGVEAPDHSAELLVLDSIFDVVKRLPGLARDPDNIVGYYYVQGMIGTCDQESLYDYTKRVGELTLGAEEPDSRVAPQVLVRIAQFQGPNSLFPSLYRLRIIGSSPSLHFLHLFLSSTLTTLELKASWDESAYYSVLSFLECAVHQAPNLSTLILGPGQFRGRMLNVSLRHKNLRRLELLEVETSITDQLLHDIGFLPVLETFILRYGGNSTYTCVLNAGSDHSTLFTALRTLEIYHGPFKLIKDLVEKVSSTDLGVLSIDITKPLKRIGTWMKAQTQTQTQTAPTDDISLGLKRQKKGSGCGSFPVAPVPPPVPPPSITDIATLIRTSIKKWLNTLFSVTLANTCGTKFQLPSDIFEDLVLHPNMKRLEITGMEIDAMKSTLDHLQVKDSVGSLELLHLPVDSGGISLTELRRIAESCPRLESLRCRFDNHSIVNIPESLSHGLKKLSIGNEQADLQQQVLFDIALYLDSIFPNIETIEGKSDDWKFISNLLNLCKAAREVERGRSNCLTITPSAHIKAPLLSSMYVGLC